MPQTVTEGAAISGLLDHLPGGRVDLLGGRFTRLERGYSRCLRRHHQIVNALLIALRLAKAYGAAVVIAEAFINRAEIEQNRNRRQQLAMPVFFAITKDQFEVRHAVVERRRK